MISHFEEENENKYLVLDDVKHKEVSKEYDEVWEGVKKEIETKKLNMGKITWKLCLNLMMICHWMNL